MAFRMIRSRCVENALIPRYILGAKLQCCEYPAISPQHCSPAYPTFKEEKSSSLSLSFHVLYLILTNHQACVLPRPIGWLSTLSPTGHANLAPYSQFNNLTFDPPYVMFAANQTPSGTQKDTARNVEATGVFCWQLATYDLREEVNKSAQQVEHGVDEFALAGLEKVPARLCSVDVLGADGIKTKVPVPMVKRSPIRFECTYHSTLKLPGNPPMGSVDVVIGRVVGIHIDESVLTEGKVDVRKTVPIARLGYFEYAAVRQVFEMRIPGEERGIMAGLEGSSKGNREILGSKGKSKISEDEGAEENDGA